jgi:hypothetical protein
LEIQASVRILPYVATVVGICSVALTHFFTLLEGKSSLLNALLDEASVLPTSGSRGCTAAVVELRFNKELLQPVGDKMPPVYKGEVEFITLQEWGAELKLLLAECSTQEDKTIYARVPDAQRQPDAAAAWQKIDQVYGRGTMELYHGRLMDVVLNRLFHDERVKRLLTPAEGSAKRNNAVVVEEGAVDAQQTKEILAGFVKMGTRLRRTKKKWAQAFRSKINDYVYRYVGGGNVVGVDRGSDSCLSCFALADTNSFFI